MLRIFAHYSAGTQLYDRVMQPVCQRFGLTQAELAVVLFLANNPGCDTAAQIVRLRHLKPSHVSLSVHGLEQKGLLVSHRQSKDRRTVRLRLTEAAGPMVQTGQAAQARFTAMLFDGFSDEEAARFQADLGRIHANVTRQLQHMEEEPNGR